MKLIVLLLSLTPMLVVAQYNDCDNYLDITEQEVITKYEHNLRAYLHFIGDRKTKKIEISIYAKDHIAYHGKTGAKVVLSNGYKIANDEAEISLSSNKAHINPKRRFNPERQFNRDFRNGFYIYTVTFQLNEADIAQLLNSDIRSVKVYLIRERIKKRSAIELRESLNCLLEQLK